MYVTDDVIIAYESPLPMEDRGLVLGEVSILAAVALLPIAGPAGRISSTVIPWQWARKLVEWLASIFLYRVDSSEETKELRGISEASGIDLYFLVALNVLLDSLLGCTSGGVMTSMGQKGGDGKRMMHFRTLDWGMDPLRSVLVVLENERLVGVSEFPANLFLLNLLIADGLRAAVIERDLDSAEVRIDSEFIIVTNNDTMSKDSDTKSKIKNEKKKSTLGLDMDDWIQESSERMDCVWRK
ncbi:uncharacterized protein RAG0_01159 [Rhynchosporium agropyri]|uniref:ceramidase n=1 Tax=Rhynchosporium agropyri TaxID=914238 RepID=A0A1E1JWB2_9HELO|nr:uncharacterized protein RAG0_01159 [Rhynchosporium agropyri]